MRMIFKQDLLSDSENDVDFSMILYELWQKKWLILGITTFVFILGILYSLRQTSLYHTDVLLQIESNKKGNNLIGSSAKKLDFFSPSENSVATHIALIQSRFILEPVIESLGLSVQVFAKQSFFSRLFSPAKSKIKIKTFEVDSLALNQPFKLIVDKNHKLKLFNAEGKLELEGNMAARLTNKDKHLLLRIQSFDGELPATFTLFKRSEHEVANQLVKQLKIKDLGGKEDTGILQVALQGSDPQTMVRILNALAEKVQFKDAEKKAMEASKALSFLDEQLPKAKAALQDAETALNDYRAQSGKIDIRLQTQSLLKQLEEVDKELHLLELKKVDMQEQYTLSHPYLNTLMQQLKALNLKKANLEQQLKSLPASDQIAVHLMRDVKIKNTLYLILLNKIQELRFMKAGILSNVRILSPAKMPDQALPQRKGLLYGGSLLLGLACSFLVIFLRKIFSSCIDSPHWIERYFNVVNLCIIPFCKEQKFNVKKFQDKRLPLLPLLAQANPRNLAIESLRSLRTSLEVALSCAPNNIVSILGIAPGVGKTFVSSNLAWLLALSGKRVLLIDADFRRGLVHENFNLPAKPGLVDLLMETASCEQVLKNTEHSHLTILASGAKTIDSSELLMGKMFKDWLRRFSKQFDIVLVDTAPILLVTDGVLVASLCGTNYLVVGAETHHPKEVAIVMKRLENAKVQVHGSIYNHFKSEPKHIPYSKYNTYYYGETQPQKKKRLFSLSST